MSEAFLHAGRAVLTALAVATTALALTGWRAYTRAHGTYQNWLDR